MTKIGKFKRSGEEYTGKIVTLSVQVVDVRIACEESRSGLEAPSHRVVVGDVEIGTAWTRVASGGGEVLGSAALAVKLSRFSLGRRMDSFCPLWRDAA